MQEGGSEDMGERIHNSNATEVLILNPITSSKSADLSERADNSAEYDKSFERQHSYMEGYIDVRSKSESSENTDGEFRV